MKIRYAVAKFYVDGQSEKHYETNSRFSKPCGWTGKCIPRWAWNL